MKLQSPRFPASTLWLLLAVVAPGSALGPTEATAPDGELKKTTTIGASPARPCDDLTYKSVREEAVPDVAESVVIDCSLSLNRRDRLTKRLVVRGSRGSGVTIACNGALIDSRSKYRRLSDKNAERDMILVESTGEGPPDNGTWQRPTDVTVKDCRIVGAVRVRGMVHSDTNRTIQEASRRVDYVEQMRRIAPTRVVFDNITITARHRIPVYFAVGVTYSKLINSELNGEGGVAVYLDAESSRNEIRNNYIHVIGRRQQIAIDASDYNLIADNRFSALQDGGIYLYRNCGERGQIRHTTPSHNVIRDNFFYYDKYSPEPWSVNPSIYLGSRNGSPGFCRDDWGFGIGSSEPNFWITGGAPENYDYARHNVVKDNRIRKLPVWMMIKQGRSTDSPNSIEGNVTVEADK
jgi:hypothetical protein